MKKELFIQAKWANGDSGLVLNVDSGSLSVDGGKTWLKTNAISAIINRITVLEGIKNGDLILVKQWQDLRNPILRFFKNLFT